MIDVVNAVPGQEAMGCIRSKLRDHGEQASEQNSSMVSASGTDRSSLSEGL